MKRCSWVNLNNEKYVYYHDFVWSNPTYDDNKLFEYLVLEMFQAGLSFEIVLNKQEYFKDAFDNYDLYKIINYDTDKIDELMHNENIIRNKLKIEAVINNAKMFLNIQKEYGSFSNYIWHFTKNKQIKYKRFHTHTKLSDKISKDLKLKGMKFVGSTIIYSYLEAIGVLNNHEKYVIKERIMYKLISKILLILMNILTVIIAIIAFCNNNYSRVLTYIAIFPILLLPFIINKTKYKLTDIETMMYYIFIFLADFLGCVVNLYNTISWYDMFVHFLSGIATFILALIIYKHISKEKNKLLKIIFCMGIVAIIAVVWELFEYFMDTYVGMNLQHTLDTGVTDTMQDMLVALLGGLLSSFYIWKKSK